MVRYGPRVFLPNHIREKYRVVVASSSQVAKGVLGKYKKKRSTLVLSYIIQNKKDTLRAG